MRIAYLVAGAGGMYCGSCMRDNRLASRLIQKGRDVVLLPLYTPIRSDEDDVSEPHVYYGGINVFLQQKSRVFRHTPWLLDRLLDRPALLRGVGRWADYTPTDRLGALTASILEGEHGRQQKELAKLVVGLREIAPTLVHLPNLMFLGIARALREALGVPVLCSLSGEDIFLDALPEPFRGRCFDLIQNRAEDADGFVAPTKYYASHAVEHFGLSSNRIHYAPMGIGVDDFVEPARPASQPFTIGYLARICPDKGLATLCDAFTELRRTGRSCRLKIAGYLGKADQPYWERIRARFHDSGDADAVEFVGEVDRAEKAAFLRSLHLFSVPTVYAESKGFYVLEALAGGVPVVQPRHGAFPEIVEATGGGLLYDPQQAGSLAGAIATLMDDSVRREKLAEQGRTAVRKSFTDEHMADQTWAIYEQYAQPGPAARDVSPAAACESVS